MTNVEITAVWLKKYIRRHTETETECHDRLTKKLKKRAIRHNNRLLKNKRTARFRKLDNASLIAEQEIKLAQSGQAKAFREERRLIKIGRPMLCQCCGVNPVRIRRDVGNFCHGCHDRADAVLTLEPNFGCGNHHLGTPQSERQYSGDNSIYPHPPSASEQLRIEGRLLRKLVY